MRRLLCLLALWPVLSFAATPLGVVTIADAGATLIRAATRQPLAEGQRVAAEDIVSTGSARHVRLELNDGVVIDLGPATQLQLQPRLTGEAARRGARLYLLQGWAKLAAPAAPAGGRAPLLATVAADLPSAGRGTVVSIEGDAIAVFAESGAATLVERRPGGGVVTLKEGHFYGRAGAAPGEVSATPRSGFIQRVPRPFLDTLPPRAAQFKGKEPASTAGVALVYADVQPWIDAEPALRGGFVPRWRALARAGEFRAALERTLPAHPEWDRVLHPERYLPRPASSPAPSPLPPNGTRSDVYR